MRVLYYDCFAGISGDMNLGAFVDLGVDPDVLRHELSKLNIDQEFHLEIRKDIKNGITGTKVDVVLKALAEEHHHHHDHDHDHDHDHGHHHHHDRNYKIIKDMIENSALSDYVKDMSIKIFYEVAVAEAKVHGKSVETVHFHEVGAVDSIVDIVGAAICLEQLKVDKILSSSIQLGGGFVMCEHGKMPVPAPATTEIVKGLPIKSGLVDKEMTTPTGAAILKATVAEFTDSLEFNIEKTAYGLGTRTLEVPNVLRLYLGTLDNHSNAKDYEQLQHTEQFMLETNIDDMNGELFAHVEAQLFEIGALDVYKTPIIMKKGRPAVKLNVLIHAGDREAILKTLFCETTTGGVREYPVAKHMMTKSYRQLETVFGTVQVKDFSYNGVCLKYKAEYEDCAKLAKANGVSIQTIYKAVERCEMKRAYNE